MCLIRVPPRVEFKAATSQQLARVAREGLAVPQWARASTGSEFNASISSDIVIGKLNPFIGKVNAGR